MSFPNSRLADLLSENPKLEGAVKLSFERFRPWIESSRLPFFPEYTDHGWKHVSEVVFSLSGLIPDKSWPVLTPSDAAIAYMSVLLHDCGMHLDEGGFFAIKSDSTTKLEKCDLAWSELWEQFEANAKRYDGKKLKKLFGSSDPISSLPTSPESLTKRDRLLIGEFLRIHHPRLAQEISHYGVPSSTSRKLKLEDIWEEDKDLLELAGLIARSHGVNLRKAVDWINQRHNARQYRGCHPTFLMVALRIADYIQLQRERAPGQVLQIKSFSSPTSLQEWDSHNAVVDIRNTHEDPEAIYIAARPKSIGSFLKLEALMKGLQTELDNCWAVMGEIYGRIEGPNQLGIGIRRVRSSLEEIEPEEFDFIPRAASFASADADLLKLLIEPLYGNSPEVGIRELLQNSVDAVRERIHLLAERGVTPANQASPKVKLEIHKEGENDILKISDNGIGMTPDIVIKYFLTAGASFRRSDDWRRNFEDAEGESMVLRAGRFGIGALAAFLIGPEIEVTTRHQSNSRGIRFTASVDDDNIELNRVSCEIGTVIVVNVSKASSAILRSKHLNEGREIGSDWDWYCNEFPAVERFIDATKLKQSAVIPEFSAEEVAPWKSCSADGYSGLLWTFSSAPFLTCNGFKVIESGMHRSSRHSSFLKNAIDVPNISVGDPNGAFPLNLQRSDIVDSCYPFENELIQSIAEDFIEFSQKILVVKQGEINPSQLNTSHTYPGSSRVNAVWGGSTHAWNEWYLTAEGFGYLHRDLLNARRFSSAYVLFPAAEDVGVRNFEKFADFFVSLPVDSAVSHVEHCLRSLFSAFLWPELESLKVGHSALAELARMKWDGLLIFVGKDVAERFIEGRKLPNYMREHAEFEVFGNGGILSLGDVGPITKQNWKEHISTDVKLTERSFVAVLQRGLENLPPCESVIVRQWIDKIGTREIDFLGTS